MKEEDAVVVVPPDPRWREGFERERALLLPHFPSATIHHVGSTAVPGLAAKPIIDIMVAVPRPGNAGRYAFLERLGYVNVPHEDDDVRLFFRKGMPRTHHLHLVRRGGEEERRHLLFRDHLCQHPDDLLVYARLKERLALQHRDDRKAYCAGKESLMADIMRRAESGL